METIQKEKVKLTAKVVSQEALTDDICSMWIQADAIAKSRESIEAALSSLRLGMTPDAVLVDVEAAMESLSEATGRVVREDITNRIFERFCVGK